MKHPEALFFVAFAFLFGALTWREIGFSTDWRITDRLRAAFSKAAGTGGVNRANDLRMVVVVGFAVIGLFIFLVWLSINFFGVASG